MRVRSSDRPVFLTVGKDEALFWVRSGPSNMKLSVSKALHYIETRKKQGKSEWIFSIMIDRSPEFCIL